MPRAWKLCLFVVCCCSTSAFVHVSRRRTSIQDISHNCELLGTNDTDEISQNEFEAVFLKLTTTGHFWIGAHVEYTDWVSFDGCRMSTARNDVGKYKYLNSSDLVRSCMDVCKGSFALHGSLCICDVKANNRLPFCKAFQCEGKAALCGRISDTPAAQQCFCYYSRIGNIENDKRVGECKLCKRDDNIFKTEDCTKKYPYICRATTTSAQQSATSWLDAALHCNNISSVFATARVGSCSLHEEWTSVFRRTKYVWGKSKYNPKNCVSLVIDNGGNTELLVKDCSEPLYAICSGLPSIYNQTSVVGQSSSPVTQKSLLIIVLCVVVILCIAIIVIVVILVRKRRSNAIYSSKKPFITVSLSRGKESSDKELKDQFNKVYSYTDSPTIEQTGSTHGAENNEYQHSDRKENYTYDTFRQTENLKINVNYDTMANIRSREENVYDETSTTDQKHEYASEYDTMVSMGKNQ